jgi:hypothetical protein
LSRVELSARQISSWNSDASKIRIIERSTSLDQDADGIRRGAGSAAICLGLFNESEKLLLESMTQLYALTQELDDRGFNDKVPLRQRVIIDIAGVGTRMQRKFLSSVTRSVDDAGVKILQDGPVDKSMLGSDPTQQTGAA